jgi:hypothetical protein
MLPRREHTVTDGHRYEDERFTDEALDLFTADDDFPREPPTPPPPTVDVIRDLADYRPTT